MIEKTKKELYHEIEEYTKILRLPETRKNFQEVAKDSNIQDISYESFLHILLTKEYNQRLINAKKNRIRNAEFPFKKYLEDLVIEDLPEDGRKNIKY